MNESFTVIQAEVNVEINNMKGYIRISRPGYETIEIPGDRRTGGMLGAFSSSNYEELSAFEKMIWEMAHPTKRLKENRNEKHNSH